MNWESCEPSFLELAEYHEELEKWETENPSKLSFLEIVKRLYTYDHIYLTAKNKYPNSQNEGLKYASEQLEALKHNSLKAFLESYPINFDQEILEKYVERFADTLKSTSNTRMIVRKKYNDTFTNENVTNNGLATTLFEGICKYPRKTDYSTGLISKVYLYDSGTLDYLDKSIFINKNMLSDSFLASMNLHTRHPFPKPPIEPSFKTSYKTNFQEVERAKQNFHGLQRALNDYLKYTIEGRYKNEPAIRDLFKKEINEILHAKDDENTTAGLDLILKADELIRVKKELSNAKKELDEYEKTDEITEEKLLIIIGAMLEMMKAKSPSPSKYGSDNSINMTAFLNEITPYLQQSNGEYIKRGLADTNLRKMLNKSHKAHDKAKNNH